MKTSLLLSSKKTIKFVLFFFAILINDSQSQYLPDLIYYKFDKNPSTTTVQNFAYPGVGSNPATITSLALTTGGQFDSCLSGTATSSAGITTGYNLSTGTSSFTISIWLSNVPTAPATTRYLFGDAGLSFRCFIGGVAGNNNIMLRGTGVTDVLIKNIAPGPTVLHIVYDSATSTIRTYKNGVADTVVTQTAFNFTAGTGLKVAGYSTSAGLEGIMDEFRFYKRALTAAEITASWNIPVEMPDYFNYKNGTASNSFPFNQPSGKAINNLFLSGDFSQPTAAPSWNQINTVYFRMSTAGTRTYTDLRILLAQSSITTFNSGAFYSGPYDTVYYRSSVSLTSYVGGWMSLTLDKPFIYDASKSLVLFAGQCGATGSAGSLYNSSTSGIRRIYSAGGCPFTVTAAGDASVANFGFDVSPASLNGTYYIPSGNFPTIASAVSALNNCGISGPVTFNVAAGYTENITTPILLTATGTSSNTITFQKYGTGLNPTVTRTDTGFVTTTVFGGQGDGVIVIQGSDYVTFNGINVAASSSSIEYGYYLRKANTNDGCKYDYIKNLAITLTKGTSPYVIGIYSSNNDSASLPSSATGITVASTGGRNENIFITGDTVSNVHAGIVLRGYNHASPYDYYDQNMVVGQSGAGNLINNFGGGSATATYGIYLIYQTSPNISYNTISNMGGGGSYASSTLYGIFMATSSAGGNFIANNNTFTLSQNSTSGAHCIYNAQLCTSININNNTFSYDGFASTTSSYMIYCSNNTPDVTVTGNKTSGTIYKSGAGQFAGYYNNGSPTSGTANISNNTFSYITLTGASTFYGIRNTTSTSQVCNINYNRISNVNGSSNTVYGIIHGYGSTCNITGDTIYNISGSNAIYGIYCGLTTPSTSLSVNGNVINMLYSSGAATVYGINSGFGTANSVYQNKIYNLSSSNASGFIHGIYISNGTATYVYNNFISDLKVPTGNAELPIVGITIAGGTATNLYYNTIFLNASSSGSTFGTSGIYTITAPTVEMVNNIVVNKSIPNGTGITTAYRRSNSTLTSYSNNSNNNCFYAGTPGTNKLIYYDGTNSIQNISDFRTLVSPKDASSFTECPPFIDTTATPYNLHLKTTDTTQCEKGGIPIASPISITTDYDGNTRNATKPDVGADEYSGIPDYPNIAYTNLANTTSTSNYVTSNWATIRDISGINTTSGTAPRLYYRKSSNTNEYIDNTSSNNGWKWVESYSSSTPFDFIIDYSKLYGGPVINGDKIFYFVIAQDVLGIPNVSMKSGTFASLPTSVDLTSGSFPVSGTVNSYMISSSTPLAGTYTIGLALFNKISGKNLVPKEFTRKVNKEVSKEDVIIINNNKEDVLETENGKNIVTETKELEERYYALSENGKEYKGPTYIEFTPEIRQQYNLPDFYTGNYANISSAIGDLNSVGISASVKFLLLDASYGESGTPEDFPITINPVTGASSSNYITIRPSTGVTTTISGSSSTSVLKLNGAGFITIDGSNSGGTDKSLTIQNTNAASSTAAVWLSSLGVGAGASYDTIKNCNIKAGINTLTTYGIFSGGTSIGTAGADNDNLQIINNSISKSSYGIYIDGTSGGEHSSVLINGNTIGSATSTDYVLSYGINALYMNYSTVSQNEIYNLKQNAAKYGIYSSTGSSYNTYSKNKIHDFDDLDGNTSINVSIGMAFVTGLTENTIDNNIIYKVFHRYGTTNNYYNCGIRIIGGTNYKLYNNSISMSGTHTRGTSGLYTTCLHIYSSATTNMDLRNNVFYNAVSNPGYTVNNYLMYATATSTFANINYNNYYTTGTNLGYFNGTVCSNLSAWKTITSQDTFSVNADPGFTSTSDLSINTNSVNCWNINGGAYPLPSITTDIAGNPRSSALNTGPADIGAYEFTPVVASPNLTVTGLPPSDGNNSSILFAGNTLAIITWHTGSGVLPTSITAVFQPQVNPPNPIGNYANENLQIVATGGSGYSYDIVYYYNLARQYTITNESDIRLAKYDASIGWEQYTTAPNATLKNITVTGINTQFSSFSLGDNTNPLPVQIKSFTSNVNGRNVKLNWITEKEYNNKGFEIERKTENGIWNEVGFVKGTGNSNKPVNYSYDDNKLNAGKYNYRLKQIDYNGNYTYFNLSTIVEIALPKEFKLSQNYPNPFNPFTKIDFDLPFDSRVRIVIYDMLGREVKTLVNSETKQAGFYTIDFNASALASGTYFYRMVANSQGKDNIFTKKMVIIK